MDAEAAASFDVVEVVNPNGRSPFVLACEHASNAIPAELGSLGLEPDALNSHIAWDPGAGAVARSMARLLDAPLVAQRVSRLVYDCNRPPEAASAIPEVSETFVIPGNRGLTRSGRSARIQRFYRPFHDALSQCMDTRLGAGSPLALVTVHSFTPVYHGRRRTVDIGVLHDADSRLADAVITVAGDGDGLVVRRNEPYSALDGVTHTLVEHGVRRGLLNVMLEIRNDLISNPDQQESMSARISRWLTHVAASLSLMVKDDLRPAEGSR